MCVYGKKHKPQSAHCSSTSSESKVCVRDPDTYVCVGGCLVLKDHEPENTTDGTEETSFGWTETVPNQKWVKKRNRNEMKGCLICCEILQDGSSRGLELGRTPLKA